MTHETLPDRITSDANLLRRFQVRLAEALAKCMDESEWSKFGLSHYLDEEITKNQSFMNSVRYQNPDYEAKILQIVDRLLSDDQPALMELFNRSEIQRWFSSSAPDILEAFTESADPLVEAIAHSLEETEAVGGIINLSTYTKRVQNALPNDPPLALGATKDMLEATMKTILGRKGHQVAKDLDFSGLTSKCFNELGLTPSKEPETDSERHTRKIVSAAKKMILTANEFRNAAGAGHGRDVDNETEVTAADASLVTSCGLILASWLIKNSEN